MFRFVFRFVGLMLIALSFQFVVHDGTKSIADQTIYISRVGPTWENIHQSSLSKMEPTVNNLAGAWVWNDVIQPYFFSAATDCTRPRHHWRRPGPAWAQERAGLTTGPLRPRVEGEPSRAVVAGIFTPLPLRLAA
jgi:hypothetical protein